MKGISLTRIPSLRSVFWDWKEVGYALVTAFIFEVIAMLFSLGTVLVFLLLFTLVNIPITVSMLHLNVLASSWENEGKQVGEIGQETFFRMTRRCGVTALVFFALITIPYTLFHVYAHMFIPAFATGVNLLSFYPPLWTLPLYAGLLLAIYYQTIHYLGYVFEPEDLETYMDTHSMRKSLKLIRLYGEWSILFPVCLATFYLQDVWRGRETFPVYPNVVIPLLLIAYVIGMGWVLSWYTRQHRGGQSST